MTNFNKKHIPLIPTAIIVIILVVASYYIGFLQAETKYLKNNLEQLFAGNNNLEQVQNEPVTIVTNLIPPTENDNVLGNRQARIALIEYSDFGCPYCASFHQTAKQMLQDRGDEVMWVFRHLPFQQFSLEKAVAAECVSALSGKDNFWAVAEKFFSGIELSEIPSYVASEFSIEPSAFQNCISGEEVANAINENFRYASEELQVAFTPAAYVMNLDTGEAYLLRGAVPYETLINTIDMMKN